MACAGEREQSWRAFGFFCTASNATSNLLYANNSAPVSGKIDRSLTPRTAANPEMKAEAKEERAEAAAATGRALPCDPRCTGVLLLQQQQQQVEFYSVATKAASCTVV